MASVDYIVVGGGPGGGPLAANLAEAGYQTLLMDAGGQDIPRITQIPAAHARASEDPSVAWGFDVLHYADPAQAAKDPKLDPSRGGVFYPRGSHLLGGSTRMNAMVWVHMHPDDCQRLYEVTGDRAFLPENFQEYIKRVEKNEYVGFLQRVGSGHGTEGWQHTNDLLSTLGPGALTTGDGQLLQIVLATNQAAGGGVLPFDINDVRNLKQGRQGAVVLPMSIKDGKRQGVAERILRAVEHAGLRTQAHALVTKVLLDENKRAIGVEYLPGKDLYQAAQGHDPAAAKPEPIRLYCRKGVVLAGGAFNTPQLLMLSGIGPKADLEQLGVECRVDLPGVGQNLMDRKEVTMVVKMKEPFAALRDYTFTFDDNDPGVQQWQRGRGGYRTNGVAVAFLMKSRPDLDKPDLVIFGAPGDFRGYKRGYSQEATRDKQHFSFAILKAYTRNKGSVRVDSSDPTKPPKIDFNYHDPVNDPEHADEQAIAKAMMFIRERILPRLGGIVEKVVEGDVKSFDEAVEYAKKVQWGHHASCTTPMGKPGDAGVVLDGSGRVLGVDGLWVSGASAFPEIPGYFIAAPIASLSEKISADILASAANQDVELAA